ncbi:hypothetical protein FYC62_06895 [Pedobacter aquae]|uniref:Tail specific protease domain-containing protein n=1 Tax=Pedobacter aquae TaxID=2605747 RepID=A0A5C0VHV3_9SPHI|nr:S41 family peptidase [Pedobacter aquae]QEK51423.1 hypothetical protein FYC62_06895 [Pedobacter aquae]
MRILNRITLIIGLMLACATANAQEYFNGNFEDLNFEKKPVGWFLSLYPNQDGEVGLDSNFRVQGKYSVSISSNDTKGNQVGFSHTIKKAFEGKTISLIASIKTKDVSEGIAGLWIRIDGRDNQVIQYNDMSDQGLKGTNDWKEYIIQVPYKEKEAAKINIGAYLKGKGRIWIDSVRIYIDSKPINEAKLGFLNSYPAESDSSFLQGSGIEKIKLSKKKIEYLSLLGEFWGFLKYHHPEIAKGNLNWDSELFRVLPLVLECKSNDQFSKILEDWIDRLGKPKPNLNQLTLNNKTNIAVFPSYGNLFNNSTFGNSLTEKLQYILKNCNIIDNYYVENDVNTYPENPIFTHERAYPELKFPDSGYMLLALYRYWSIIQYFSPNRYLINPSWDKSLSEFIPKFVKIDNSKSYVLALKNLISSIHDSHAYISSGALSESQKGDFRVPFKSTFINDSLVVTGYYSDTLEVERKFLKGDVILSINGEKVKNLVDKYLPITFGSNLPAQLREMTWSYLLRNSSRHFMFTILRNGIQIKSEINGVELSEIDFYKLDWFTSPFDKSFYKIDNEIGYIFPGIFKNADIEPAMSDFENTKGIIIDMRCYPNDQIAVFNLINRLKNFKSPFLKYSNVSISYPGLFTFTKPLEIGDNNSKASYNGKIIVIVNSLTQSSAEFATIAFQSMPNVTVIGTPSAGADGGVSKIIFPGNVSTGISDVGIYYPDGSQTQQVGIKIDYIVKQSIEGMKNGIDEQLEIAKKIILEK